MPSIPAPLALIAEALNCPAASLSEASRLGQHPNWDSVGHLGIMLALERHYGVAISDETIRRYDNIAAIQERYVELAALSD